MIGRLLGAIAMILVAFGASLLIIPGIGIIFGLLKKSLMTLM